MRIRSITLILLLTLPVYSFSQTAEINMTDPTGKKQGLWIKKYPDGTIEFEGTFKDDHPAGEFKRYYESSILKSKMIYSHDGKEVEAIIYHPNGLKASEGKYIDQEKEGIWRFFSSDTGNYLIAEEEYSRNRRNGHSVKFFPDGTIAEKMFYVNDKKEQEWTQYYSNGKLFLKSSYSNDMLNGQFEVWFENGQIEFSGSYKNNLRDGKWKIFYEDGTLRYELDYIAGYTKNRQMDIDATEFMDNLEKNKHKIQDPEITGDIR